MRSVRFRFGISPWGSLPSQPVIWVQFTHNPSKCHRGTWSEPRETAAKTSKAVTGGDWISYFSRDCTSATGPVEHGTYALGQRHIIHSNISYSLSALKHMGFEHEAQVWVKWCSQAHIHIQTGWSIHAKHIIVIFGTIKIVLLSVSSISGLYWLCLTPFILCMTINLL